jgi:NTP pyrophosphatase (non-canonical NTP hydrolase)
MKPAWRSSNTRKVSRLETKTIALPRLNGLYPTLESTALKLMEEAGELSKAIGRYQGVHSRDEAGKGHEDMQRITRELLDVAQTAITMMFVLEEQHGVDLNESLSLHLEKLIEKGYLHLE